MLDLAKKRKVYILLTLIIIFGAYLRLDNFHDLVRFNVDQARDAEIVDSMLEKNDFPLVGPKAGGTPFQLGPAFYYMAYLSAIIFGHDPSGIAYFVPILSILSIILFFILLRFYFSNTIALYLSFLYAISFFSIKYSRFAWNPNIIPFFMFLFLISLLIISQKTKNSSFWAVILGISIGIGVQLHTFLLILMPLSALVCLGAIYLKDKREFSKKLLIVLVIGLILNASFFLYDFQNNWENTRSFFHGAENKTDKNQSLASNLLLEGKFFVQGFRFVLSGYEPPSDIIKLIKSFKIRYFKDMLAIVLGIVIFVFGIIQSVRYFRSEKNESKLNFFRLHFVVVAFSALLFFLVAKELDVRFYTIIIFFPFMIFGIVIKYLGEKIGKTLFIAVMAVITTLLVASNISSYRLAYDFSTAEGKSELYGGISLKEAESISNYITDYSKKSNNESKMIYLFPFEYSRSLGYFIRKSGSEYIVLADDNFSGNNLAFLIGKSKNKERISEDNKKTFRILEARDMGRFSILVLEK